MSTAGHPDALVRRIEQLAASSADEPEGAALAALLGALRSETSAVRADVGSLRSETSAVRADLDGLGGRLAGSVAAGRAETGQLARRVAELGSRLDGLGGRVEEVRRSLTSGLERDTRASAAQSVALEDARGALEARLAVLEDVLDALSERIEALARDGAGTTTDLLSSVLQAVRGVERRVEEQERSSADALARAGEAADARASALAERLLDRLGDVLAERDEALRAELRSALAAAEERAARDRAAAEESAAEVRSALDGVGALLERSLSGLEGRLTAAVAELGTTFSRTLADVAGEVHVAATTTRDASARVATLAELGDLQRAEVERLLQVVQDRLAAVDAAVAEDATATSRVAAGLTEVVSATTRLEETVGGFRAEWPTRTYEVVEGAKAVAQGVVLDVREEVAARLEQVRAVLASAVQGMDQARSAEGGLDLGQPERRAEPGGEARQGQPTLRTAVRTVTAVAKPAAARPAPGGSAVLPGPGKRVPAPGGTAPAKRPRAGKAPAARGEAAPTRARHADGPADETGPEPAPAAPGTAVGAGAAEDTTGDAGSPVAGQAPAPGTGPRPAAGGAGGRPADRRGRLDAMPEVPSVSVALDAAAPQEPDASLADPDGDDGSRPAGSSAG